MKLVSMGISKHALQLLPTCKKHSPKTRFKDAELQRLCKESKHTWTEWVDAGRPTSGDLYERKNSQKREVRCRINVLEAIRERRRIQCIDHGFRNQHPRRFSKPKCSVPCSKLHINECTITEKPELLQAWKSHFSSLSKTKITDAVVDQTLQDELIRMAHSSHNNEDHVFDIDLEFEEVDKAVVHLSNGKATGPDGMTGEHLKYGGSLKIPLIPTATEV